jgi:transposase-like protein
MIVNKCSCSVCGSIDIVKNGVNAAGSQRYKCKSCGVTRVLNYKWNTKKVDKEAVFRSFSERAGSRPVARIFNISHTTVSNWIKKKREA